MEEEGFSVRLREMEILAVIGICRKKNLNEGEKLTI